MCSLPVAVRTTINGSSWTPEDLTWMIYSCAGMVSSRSLFPYISTILMFPLGYASTIAMLIACPLDARFIGFNTTKQKETTSLSKLN